jgi:hypothetical protein
VERAGGRSRRWDLDWDGLRGLPSRGVLQSDPLKYLGLRQVAVERLGQYLERYFVGRRDGKLADYCSGMRRNELRSDDLATAATRIDRR